MESLQQTVFRNLGQSTVYNYDSKKFTDKHTKFPKYRYQQIQNEFQLVDLHNKGMLTQKQIVNYLSQKYQWINISILKQIFKSMDWENGTVSKKQFSQKYLSREKKLYHDITGLKYYNTWTRTLQQIFNQQTIKGRPRAYFFSQIKSLQLYQDGKPIQWMDLKIQYENHENKINYQIQQAAHQASYPSFQIWLPSQKDNFFLTFKFLNPKTQQIYGQCYISIPLQKNIQKLTNMNIQITKLGKKVGNCQCIVKAQTSIQRVKEQMKQIKQKSASYSQIVDNKIKQYQYLQFLWGVKHRSPHKITHVDAAWMLILRTIFIILLGIFGLIVHILGRSQPLSLILTFLLLRNRQYILLRNQKFLITWIVLASILIDIVWIVVAAGTPSQINFIDLSSAQTLTYFLLVIKGLLFGYLLFFQKSFDDNE